MPRIRTIKPEFPQSESMGRISRDARLTFILLWTQADDSGRLRGSSRMLASVLFPYDDDAIKKMDTWLNELRDHRCIIRYEIDDNSYIQICNWLIHQKIDKPSESKIPPFDESSRILANPLEHSSLDQGSRIKDQGMDQGEDRKRFAPPSIEEVTAFFTEKGHPKEAQKFFNFYDSKGWMVGKNKMQKWKSSAAGWLSRNHSSSTAQPGPDYDELFGPNSFG